MKVHAYTSWGSHGKTFCGLRVVRIDGSQTHNGKDIATTRKPTEVTCGRCVRAMA